MFDTPYFRDRAEAGRRLAEEVRARGFTDAVVLALPRGGVPVAAEIAEAIGAPLDLLLVRKIGAPLQPELAVAAVIDGDEPQTVVNEEVAGLVGADEEYIKAEAARQLEEIERRRKLYLGGRPPLPVAGRTAIVVDDGIATGATMRAALKGLRRRGPARIVLAVSVAPPDTLKELARDVDEIICLAAPASFHAISVHYRYFPQVGDSEVIALMERAQRAGTGGTPPPAP